MSKYDNYIYLTICEVSFESFEKTNFATYTNYCRTFKSSLLDGNLSSYEKKCIIQVSDMLDKIYGMNIDMTSYYINEFFQLEKFIVFEKIVRTFKMLPKMGDY